MIFSDGITESARNASVRNGVAPDQPSAAAASLRGAAARDHLGERRVGEQAGDRERALGDDPPVVDGDDAAADRGEVADGERHVVVAHPDDDEVVGVVRHRRGERAALRGPSRRRSRGRSGRSRGGARRRRSWRGRPRRRRPRDRRRRPARARATPSRPDPRSARSRGSWPPAEGIAKSDGGDRLHAHRLAHPLGHGHRRDVLDRPAALEHEVGQRSPRGRAAGAGRPGSRERPRRGGRGRATGPGGTRPSAARPPA